ncbi:MAG: hypothetical protein Q9183_001520 [Haloplaca sp. 2 TL-2023]
MPHKRKKKTPKAGLSKTSKGGLPLPAAEARDSTADKAICTATTNPEVPEEESTSHADSRTSKRLKTNSGRSLAVRVPESSVVPDEQDQDAIRKGSPASAEPVLAPEIQPLQTEFHFSTMSIISSSKIQQKVKILLERVKKSTNSTAEDKPGVVIMQAKAPAVAKMISVVEIAKTDIAGHHGVWYQYSKLRSEFLPLKQRKQKSSQTSGTHTTLLTKAAQTAGTDPDDLMLDDEDAGERNVNGEEGSEDDVEAFEEMEHQPSTTSIRERARVRATPIMNIYFSSVPIPALKSLLG